jgi:hypothetical protein
MSKSEIRNKIEIINLNVQKGFEFWSFENSNLFRISTFEFRIFYAEFQLFVN